MFRTLDGCIVPVLARLEKFIRPPVGQSLLFVARRSWRQISPFATLTSPGFECLIRLVTRMDQIIRAPSQ
ncbi:MAG TPA: hypothetical protein VL970_03310 [Candidatus Acidoferrales bacterium]|nr:hypothetical protein [Candidatus Acidoferrales bacterium]